MHTAEIAKIEHQTLNSQKKAYICPSPTSYGWPIINIFDNSHDVLTCVNNTRIDINISNKMAICGFIDICAKYNLIEVKYRNSRIGIVDI